MTPSAESPPSLTASAPMRSRLRPADVWSVALTGLRGRPVRAVLSAAGIAIGIATLVATLGVASSSRSQLLAEIDALGTNLLTVTPSQLFGGPTATLPAQAPGMISRIGPVLADSAIGDVGADVHLYRDDRTDPADTNAITVYAAQPTLLGTLQGRLAHGAFLNAATEYFPAVVLGADTARVIGVDRADGSVQVWLGNRWFSVIGVLQRLPLAPELDRSALVGYPIAERYLGSDGSPAEIYVRSDPTSTRAVAAVLAATADPAAPQNVGIANPADALIARADAGAALQSLYLALGAVALLVGGIGIANTMVIAVLERRSEIGVRRALGATQTHIAAQFLAESAMLALFGGLAGAVLGGFATSIYATARNWNTVIPPQAMLAATAAATVVGSIAGLYPALRAARLAPTEALRIL